MKTFNEELHPTLFNFSAVILTTLSFEDSILLELSLAAFNILSSVFANNTKDNHGYVNGSRRETPREHSEMGLSPEVLYCVCCCSYGRNR